MLAFPEESVRIMSTVLETGPVLEGTSRYFSLFASLWAQRDPVAASTAMKALPGDFQIKVLPEIASVWVQSDPAAAAKWLQGLPDGKGREMAAQNIANTWSRHDPEAAAAWARGLPEGAVKNVVTKEMTPTPPGQTD